MFPYRAGHISVLGYTYVSAYVFTIDVALTNDEYLLPTYDMNLAYIAIVYCVFDILFANWFNILSPVHLNAADWNFVPVQYKTYA